MQHFKCFSMFCIFFSGHSISAFLSKCLLFVFGSEGSIQLDCLGGIQDKITVCATDDSYQKARESMAQVEEETRSRSAIVIKPGGRYVGEDPSYQHIMSVGQSGMLSVTEWKSICTLKTFKWSLCLCSLSFLCWSVGSHHTRRIVWVLRLNGKGLAH